MIRNPLLKKSKEADDIAIIGQDKLTEKMLDKLINEQTIDDVGTITKDENGNDILHCKDRVRTFGLPFLELIQLFEKKHGILELYEKDIKDESKEDKEIRADYSLKKVILLFSNRKGGIRRTIIIEKQVNDEQNSN